jgi:hypothetical protein
MYLLLQTIHCCLVMSAFSDGSAWLAALHHIRCFVSKKKPGCVRLPARLQGLRGTGAAEMPERLRRRRGARSGQGLRWAGNAEVPENQINGSGPNTKLDFQEGDFRDLTAGGRGYCSAPSEGGC